MILRASSLALLIGLSMVGCASRAGPFVTRIASDGRGGLEIERCMIEYDDGMREISTGACRRETIALSAPAEDPRARARAIALALTNVAATAARRGDCVTVGEIEPQVRGLDAGFRDTVFVRDVAIARCLTPAAS